MNKGKAKTDRKGRETLGRAFVGRPEDDEQEHHGHDHLGDQDGRDGIPADRMFTVSIRGKPLGDVESGLAGRDEIEDPARGNRAEDLRNDIRQQLVRGETAAGPQPDGNRRIEVAAGDVSDGVGHRQHGQTEGE